MEWWQIKDLMIASGILLAVLIPVVGVTARFTLSPIIDKFAKMRAGDTQRLVGDVQVLRDEVESLRHQIGEMETTIQRLREVNDFERQLRPPPEHSEPR